MTTSKTEETHNAVRQLRQLLGMSPADFARALKVSHVTVARWETMTAPRSHHMQRMEQMAEDAQLLDIANKLRSIRIANEDKASNIAKRRAEFRKERGIKNGPVAAVRKLNFAIRQNGLPVFQWQFTPTPLLGAIFAHTEVLGIDISTGNSANSPVLTIERLKEAK